ncbi:MAG: hypothetical protein AAFN17_18725, partial [Pseudomonadota bacterium]
MTAEMDHNARDDAPQRQSAATVSGRVKAVLDKAAGAIDAMDDDPMIREVLARTAIREFSAAMARRFESRL